MNISRRTLLKSAGALSATTGFGVTSSLGSFAAHAADTSGYKALVCLFFKGGMDNHDTLLPYDTASYNRLSEIRSELFNSYNRLPNGSTRTRGALLPLAPANQSDFGTREFALPPELGGIHDLFTQGRVAIAGNVGPLIEPINRTTFRDRSAERPARLFSHNDQQSTWMALTTEGARFGWGGRFADAALNASANLNPVFTAITVSGNEVFLTGERTVQYKIGSGGTQTIREIDNNRLLGSGRNSDVAQAMLLDHLRGEGLADNNLFETDISTITRRAIDSNSLFEEAIDTATPFATVFPDSRLGGQLASVARTISVRNSLGAARQVFFVSIGGFDTHARQPSSLPNLHTQISDAVVAFYNATVELGVENDVTLFTASDFGRTLVNNDDGSDHGWGAHHFIVGGAVNGGRIFGDVPPWDVDHQYDAGRGRLIPTTSIEQFAAPLGRWFGLNDTELNTALPLLPTFSTPPTFV